MNKSILIVLAVFVGPFVCSARGYGNERHISVQEALQRGYRPFKAFHNYRGVRGYALENVQHNLSWPVQFQDASQTIAQNYLNFQEYGGGAYFHKGCDLRSPAGSTVTAPVTGVLEGGYYSYGNNPDGSETKMWIPWNGKAHYDPYFELALVTPDGYRFELHHVDSENLPASTVEALNKGGVTVPAGAQIGKVLPWPDGVYNHIHYNIFRQDEVILNPEAYSVQVPDHVAPTIYGVYGIKTDGSVIEAKAGQSVAGPLTEFVIATTETRDQSIYVQTPPFVGIKFNSGFTTFWDFREKLLSSDGQWPDIRNVFLPALLTPSGQRLETFGQYGKGLFLMRLKVAGQSGPFSIKVGDTAGNFATFEGTVVRAGF